MKKTVLVATLLAVSTFGVGSAFATVNWPSYPGNGGGNSNCNVGTCTDKADIRQKLEGFQKAINLIVDVNDANKIVQDAINAGNLITLDIGLATVVQDANVWQKAINTVDGHKWSDFVDVTQSATNVVNSINGKVVLDVEQKAGNSQLAKNEVLGGKYTKMTDLEQAATNVVNTITATTSKYIEQTAYTDQLATNLIVGGKGGYDAPDVNWTLDTAIHTQAAVNAANLINLENLDKGSIDQKSIQNQTALNTAYFGYSFSANVYDFGQSATNVANSASIKALTAANCNCVKDGIEIDQFAKAHQISDNLLQTFGNVSNSVQAATNVANSISAPKP